MPAALAPDEQERVLPEEHPDEHAAGLVPRRRPMTPPPVAPACGSAGDSVRFMYTPPFNRAEDEDELRRFVARARAGWLVTNGQEAAPSATYLPVLWREDRVIAHVARANPHWREIGPDTPALVIVTGPDAYVSPTWYAAKAEHGKVVPTWNYSAVHLTGLARVHDDPAWLRMAVEELTAEHEGHREDPWHVSDAPGPYIDGQLRGIVGVELRLTLVEGKAKLSQNRSRADREGVVTGLRETGRPDEQPVADQMAAIEEVGDR